MPTYCYMDIALGSAEPRRVAMELFDDVCPRTCKNFADLCRGLEETVPGSDVPMSYKGSGFHRVIDGFMIQGGDYTNHNGTGGHSIYGSEFDDENFDRLADRPGLLAMANRGPNTNGSQFFITCAATPHLNGKHTVFGKVVTGMNVVRAVESTPRGDNDKPVAPVVIKACGVLEARPEPEVAADGDKLPDYPVDCDPALDDAEKLAAGEEVRQLGNRAFGAQEFKRGVEKYEKALRYLDAAVPTSATGDDLKTKKVACWNNMALCLIKLEKWAPARKAAQAALDLDAANAKAVFRRATAHQALGDYDEAVADYKRVLELDAANGDAQARLAEVSQLMKAKKEKMAAQYKKMFA